MTRREKRETERQRLDDLRRDSGLLTVNETAAILGRSRRFVYTLVEDGKIPHSRIAGGTVVFRRQRIFDWIDELEQGPSGTAD